MKKSNVVLRKEYLDVILNSHWNKTTRDAVPSFILCNTLENGLIGLLHFLKEKQIKDKDNFNIYWGSNLISSLVDYLNLDGTLVELIQALKDDPQYRNFNWSNWNILYKNDLPLCIRSFNTKFNGDVISVHRIYNDKYIIIETSETNFYYVNNNIYNSVSNHYFEDFESALFHAMCGDQFISMKVIYDSQNNK